MFLSVFIYILVESYSNLSILGLLDSIAGTISFYVLKGYFIYFLVEFLSSKVCCFGGF